MAFSVKLEKAQLELERKRSGFRTVKPAELDNGRKQLDFRRQLAKVEPTPKRKQINQSKQGLKQRLAAVSLCELLIKLNRIAERKERRAASLHKYGPPCPRAIRAYPALLTALLKAEMVSAARVWLLLKAIDQDGRGSLALTRARYLLTGKMSRWQVFSRRRYRQIMAEGEGVLWSITDDRIYLKSPAKVAILLDCGCLDGLPIELPTKVLLSKIGDVRAHFYASFESGRREAHPISRAALAGITGVNPRQQRRYDARLKRTTRKNIAITGIPYTLKKAQAMAQDKERVTWKFTDWLGKQGGRKKAAYIAYRIADTRSAAHKQAARGRRKKINQEINLVSLSQGNNELIDRAYYASGEAAVAAFNRDSGHDRYYPSKPTGLPNVLLKTKLEGVSTWGVIQK